MSQLPLYKSYLCSALRGSLMDHTPKLDGDYVHFGKFTFVFEPKSGRLMDIRQNKEIV